MTVTFLGTGTSQGVPVISCTCQVCSSLNAKDKRLRTSILISHKNTHVAIDCTPDFRQQMLEAKPSHLDAIVFTHEHQDHVSGLDDVRAFNFIQQKDMQTFATERVNKRLLRLFDYAFSERKYPGAPHIGLNTISGEESFKVGDIDFLPVKAMHGNWPVLGFRFKNSAYLTDVNYVSPKEEEKLEGIDTLIVSALRKEKHHSHFSLGEAIEFSQKIDAKEVYITHISHQMGLHKEVGGELPPNVHLAYDGLKLELD